MLGEGVGWCEFQGKWKEMGRVESIDWECGLTVDVFKSRECSTNQQRMIVDDAILGN